MRIKGPLKLLELDGSLCVLFELGMVLLELAIEAGKLMHLKHRTRYDELPSP